MATLVQRVAVIGGGPAGVATGRILRDYGLSVTIFERASQTGGVWRDDDHNRVIYDGLVSNLPKEIMQFEGFPFDSTLPSFIKPNDMLRYLHQYVRHHDLSSMIELNRTVTDVTLSQSDHWEVTHVDTRSVSPAAEVLNDDTKMESFDAVVVANGHYEVPYHPSGEDAIAGLEEFSGVIVHSKDYRNPSSFIGKKVLVVGGKASGSDIARQVSTTADHVTVVTRSKYEGLAGDNVTFRCDLSGVSKDNVSFYSNGESEPIDAIILCTGYEYSFPFLSEEIISVKDRRIHPLYLQIFHACHPTLAFIGIPFTVVPFPLFEIQARLTASVFNGSVELPSYQERLSAIEDSYSKVRRVRETHGLAHLQWDYSRDIFRRSAPLSEEESSTIEAYIDICEAIYNHSYEYRKHHPDDSFRRCEYQVHDRLHRDWSVQTPP